MKRRIVITVIMLSMMLHCSSKLGLLTYLYANRNEIAYTIGLISEVPIALCSSDYNLDHRLVIQDPANDRQQSVPPILSHAQDIKLFTPGTHLSLTRISVPVIKIMTDLYSYPTYGAPALEIFHPPLLFA